MFILCSIMKKDSPFLIVSIYIQNLIIFPLLILFSQDILKKKLFLLIFLTDSIIH